MLSRPRYWNFMLSAAILALPSLAQGQVIFSDSDFLPSNYTTSTAGNVTDIRFNLDYSSFLPFDPDTFLTVSVPPSPRGGGTTTGLFVTANNDSFQDESAAMAAAIPNGVSVGTGTANPNYVMRVDVFHSTGNGIDDGAGVISGNESLTNYSYVGINQSNTTVQLGNLNAPGATGGLTGQGLGLSITADGDAQDDFIPIYGGARYHDRDIGEVEGQLYSQASGVTNTGLLSMHLNDYWTTQGFEFDESDTEPPIDGSDNLNRFTGNSAFFAPDPANPAGYLPDGSGVDKSPFIDAFPEHDEPLHYSGANLTSPAFLAPNTSHRSGGSVPYNKWATHELYWVDGQFTYVITYDHDGDSMTDPISIPMVQITPDGDGLNGDDNVFSPFSSAGSVVLGFFDRFASVAGGPEGANFVVYDNLEIEVADAGDVPNAMQYLIENGYTIAEEGTPGDFDLDGDVDGRDFLTWQRDPNVGNLSDWQDNYGGGGGLAAVTVPEPTSLVLLVSLAGIGLIARRL